MHAFCTGRKLSRWEETKRRADVAPAAAHRQLSHSISTSTESRPTFASGELNSVLQQPTEHDLELGVLSAEVGHGNVPDGCILNDLHALQKLALLHESLVYPSICPINPKQVRTCLGFIKFIWECTRKLYLGIGIWIAFITR